ncbi:MAG: ABC transporter ATP-binding protein [Chloroflexota bacterium]
MNIKIKADGITHGFSGSRNLFDSVSFEVNGGEVFGIYGKNGSGKSTMLKALFGLLHLKKGKTSISLDCKELPRDEYSQYVGFAAPYINLYEEFTAPELLDVVGKLRGTERNPALESPILEKFMLEGQKYKPIKAYSSGMKQRAKLMIATYFNPLVLFLDEPGSNLDDIGVNLVNSLVKEYAEAGKIVLIATNESREKALCTNSLSL